MKKRLQIFVRFFQVACLLLPFYSQSQQSTFINYSIQDGLTQSQVQSIIQDNNGFLWAGTLGGISKFDGTNFTNLSIADGLLDNQINELYKDKHGNIWMGALGGVMVYDGKKVHSFELPVEHKTFNITCFSEDNDQNIWMGTDGLGVYKVNYSMLSKNPKIELSKPIFNSENGLPSQIVRSLLYNKEKLMIGTKKGLVYYSSDNLEKPTIELSNANISCLVKNLDNEIWVGTYGEGIYLADNNLKKTLLHLTVKDGLTSDWIRSANISSTNQLHVCTKKGVNILALNSYNEPEIITHTTHNGLPTNKINCSMQDSEGNTWYGSDGKGLLRATNPAFTLYTSTTGISSNQVMTILEDQNNTIWAGTYDNGVCSIGKNRQKRINAKNGLSNNTVWCSLRDHKNNLWFGTSSGLNMYNGKKTITFSEKDGLGSKKVTSLFEDSKNNLWVGSAKGVNLITEEGISNSLAAEISIKNVRNIKEDSKGNIWLGTSTGLLQYNGLEFMQFTTKDGLAHNTVYSIAIDGSDNVWMGTKNGLVFLKNNIFFTVSVGNDYRSNVINFLQFDNLGSLWVGTNNGIYNLDVPAYYQTGLPSFVHYSQMQGVSSLETNLNGSYLDGNGNLWFATGDGLLHYNTNYNSNTKTEKAPYINLTNVQLFLEDVSWGETGEEFSDNSSLPISSSLQHNQNHLTFYYKGIHFGNPNAVKYQYKLEGFDDEWTPITNADFATYSNLSPGSYTFLVRSCNSNGIWTKQPASFAIEIMPPFWATWWFYLICLSVATYMVYRVYLWKTLSNQRKIRTQQLIQKSKMLVLEQQSLNESMNKHFIFNALNSIQYYINNEDKKAANEYLASFAKLIRKNLNDVNSNLVSLSEEIERLELYLSLEHMRFEKKFRYQINIEKDIPIDTIKIPSMILQPFVENSIKHGILPMDKQGNISIHIYKNQKGELVFGITDNGIGVNNSINKKLKKNNGHISKGLQITKGRLALFNEITKKNIRIQGPEEIKDKFNRTNGTKVEITLPFNFN